MCRPWWRLRLKNKRGGITQQAHLESFVVKETYIVQSFSLSHVTTSQLKIHTCSRLLFFPLQVQNYFLSDVDVL